jgi:hypothetical protein
MEGWRGVGLGGGERERLERKRERELLCEDFYSVKLVCARCAYVALVMN